MKTTFFAALLAFCGASSVALAIEQVAPSTDTNPSTPAVVEPAPAAPVPATQWSAEVADVVKLVKAKVDERTIVAFVTHTDREYKLDAEAIVELKQQGVSDAVLTAMLQPKERATKPVTSAMAAAVAPQGTAPYSDGQMGYDPNAMAASQPLYAYPDYSYSYAPSYYPYYSSYYYPYWGGYYGYFPFYCGYYYGCYPYYGHHGYHYPYNHYGHNGYHGGSYNHGGYHGSPGAGNHGSSGSGAPRPGGYQGGYAGHNGAPPAGMAQRAASAPRSGGYAGGGMRPGGYYGSTSGMATARPSGMATARPSGMARPSGFSGYRGGGGFSGGYRGGGSFASVSHGGGGHMGGGGHGGGHR